MHRRGNADSGLGGHDKGQPQEVGATPLGLRRVLAIVGGTIRGERISGVVLSGGGDWMVIGADGWGRLDVRMQWRTDDGAVIYASEGVAWTLGQTFHVLRGGVQRRTGLQSRIEVHPIVAVRGAIPSRAWRQTPTLSNAKMFVRDRHVCAYCGDRFHTDDLTREHITPTSRGGGVPGGTARPVTAFQP